MHQMMRIKHPFAPFLGLLAKQDNKGKLEK